MSPVPRGSGNQGSRSPMGGGRHSAPPPTWLSAGRAAAGTDTRSSPAIPPHWGGYRLLVLINRNRPARSPRGRRPPRPPGLSQQTAIFFRTAEATSLAGASRGQGRCLGVLAVGPSNTSRPACRGCRGARARRGRPGAAPEYTELQGRTAGPRDPPSLPAFEWRCAVHCHVCGGPARWMGGLLSHQRRTGDALLRRTSRANTKQVRPLIAFFFFREARIVGLVGLGRPVFLAPGSCSEGDSGRRGLVRPWHRGPLRHYLP